MQLSKSRILLFGIMLMVAGSLLLVPIFAQGNTTVITIGVQSWQRDFLDDEAFEDFEAEHPGVDVVIVVIDDDTRFFATPQEADEVAEYMTNVNALAAEADLLPLDLFSGVRLSTRAGMYLDINPLMNADANANTEDFYPAMLQSVQWDGATWGLPMSGSVQLVIYNQTAFDEAGLGYPDSSWTLDNFINAGEVLSEFDEEGNLTVPGFFGFDTGLLFASVLDNDLSDPASFPSLPSLVTPQTIQMVEQWAAFDAEYSPDFSQGFNFDFNAIPLTIDTTFRLNDDFNIGGPDDANFQGTMLPGNRAGLQVQAYGISAGTNNPQLAYELLQYMTQTPEIAFSFFGDSPARQSLLTADTSDLPIFRPENPEELQALIDEALLNAIPQSQLEFVRYLSFASSQVNSEEEPVDAETALQNFQEQLTEVYLAVGEQANTNVIEVATPVPTPVLQSGQVALNFGVESFFGPGSGDNLWQEAIDEFVAQDPQVGQILVDTGFFSLDERIEEQDCFYLASNAVTTADLSLLFTVDPFLTTDANLDMSNFVNGTIDQITRDGAMWAVPLSITPNVMWYNPEIFAEAGLPEPTNGWTITEFVDALIALDAVTEGAPYSSESFGSTYLYQLIAAYGGTPIDYSTVPYTINITDPTNIEAIRQVLSLAQNELINYQELGNFGGGGFFGGNRALTDATLLPNDFRIQNRNNGATEYQKAVMFPRGANTIPLSYDLGVGMISSNTPAPDACYRWLSFLSRRSELLTGMPAQVDMFDLAVENITDGDDIAALYQAFNEALASPEVVVIPGLFSGSSSDPATSTANFLRENWINLAFDNIVLNDVDVEIALEDAQQYINDYDQCSAGIEPPDQPLAELSDEESQDYFIQFLQCAVDVDPSLEDQFGPVLETDEDE